MKLSSKRTKKINLSFLQIARCHGGTSKETEWEFKEKNVNNTSKLI